MVVEKSSKSWIMGGYALLLIGLFIAVFYAVMCRYDVEAKQLSDLTFVVLGVSVRLVGLGLIISRK